MGEYVSKGKSFFDEADDRLRAPQQIAHESSGPALLLDSLLLAFFLECGLWVERW